MSLRCVCHCTCGAFDPVAWLESKGVRIPAPPAAFFREMFAEAGEHPDLASLLRAIGASPSTTRFWMRKKRIPPPAQWFCAARGLALVEMLRLYPERSVASVGASCGFPDHSAISQHLRRSFGVGAAQVRDIPGNEWLMDLWWERAVTRKPARSA